jgi:F-type H+-transporting ATPase subunit delta
MSEIQVASRYAKSLIDLAEEQNVLEKVKSDIEGVVKTLRENGELRAVLSNPIVYQDQKFAILNQLFGSSIEPMILAFFKIVVNKGRSGSLYETVKQFLQEYNVRKGIIKASVISAAPLSEENRKEIIQVVEEATKGHVILEATVNPDLIGGFVLKVGDNQFDTTISGRLNRLKKEFAQSAY